MKKETRVKIFVSFITILFLIISIINFILVSYVYRLSTDDCLWKSVEMDGKRTILIDKIFKGGITDKAGIKDGDILLKINEKEFTNTGVAQIYLNSIPEGETVLYTVKRGEKIHEFIFKIKKISNIQALIQAIIGFVFLFIGLMVIINNPMNMIARLFEFI